MDRLKNSLKELIRDKSFTGRLYAVTLGAALLMLAVTVRGPDQQGHIVTGSGGNVVSIERHSMTAPESYDVTLTVGKGSDAEVRDVTIDLRAAETADMRERTGDADADTEEAERDAEIDRMLTELEYSDDETVKLPSALADGTPVTWTYRKQEDRSGIILIPVMYMILVLCLIKSGLDKMNDPEAGARREIMKGLPRFCNQLFLMMNAGMILSDAFERICASYAEYGEDHMSVFEKELTALCMENDGHRKSTATLINEYAARHNVKELVRIATILTENERRGSDVIESLSRESSYLWDDRKIVARESGKMIDLKMSWPLGMLLILLIVITMAPALLNM